MNNKGFAITSIIYGLMILFMVVVTSFISILIGRNRRIDELVKGVYNSVEYEEITINKEFFNNDNAGYATEKRALYHFDIDKNGVAECSSFLPKNTILLLGEQVGVQNKNDIYFYYPISNEDKNSQDITKYKEITCLESESSSDISDNEVTSQNTLSLLNLTVTSGTINFKNTSCSSGCDEATVGIYAAEDDLGTSYYFRGDVTNNYVKFGKNSSNQDMYWRIIRINGDGTIRMIYDGTQAHANGTSSINKYIGTRAFNSNYNDNTYVGYMYGDTGQSTFELTHSNKYDSPIKIFLEGTSANNYTDGWYYENIVATGYHNYVADAIYCSDRSLDSGTGLGSDLYNTTDYGAYERFFWNLGDNDHPTLKCDLDGNTTKRDSFTVYEGLGNGLLNYPVGLITADEISYAGGAFYTYSRNYLYYLYCGNSYWTMTPFKFDSRNAQVMFMNSNGGLDVNELNYSMHIRPVISLKANTIKYGTGSKVTPFAVEN